MECPYCEAPLLERVLISGDTAVMQVFTICNGNYAKSMVAHAGLPQTEEHELDAHLT